MSSFQGFLCFEFVISSGKNVHIVPLINLVNTHYKYYLYYI